jgi:hypothetical protein
LYSAGTWTLRKVDQNYPKNAETCWRRKEKMIWTDLMRNKLYKVMENRNTLRTIKWSKDNLIGHILPRNCILKHVTKGNIGKKNRRKDKEEDVSC